jgi:ribosomal protein S27AE
MSQTLEEYKKEVNKSSTDRLTKNKSKRSQKICPRCGKPTVNKDMRKCMACGGYLLWSGDTAGKLNENMLDWYRWDKYNGIEGFYHSSFYRQGWK